MVNRIFLIYLFFLRFFLSLIISDIFKASITKEVRIVKKYVSFIWFVALYMYGKNKIGIITTTMHISIVTTVV